MPWSTDPNELLFYVQYPEEILGVLKNKQQQKTKTKNETENARAP